MTSNTNKLFLKVPYSEKDLAKTLGAKWDASNRSWYWAGEGDLPSGLLKYNTSETSPTEALLVLVSFNGRLNESFGSWRAAYKYLSECIGTHYESTTDEEETFIFRIECSGKFVENETGWIMFDALCEDGYAMQLYFQMDSRNIPVKHAALSA